MKILKKLQKLVKEKMINCYKTLQHLTCMWSIPDGVLYTSYLFTFLLYYILQCSFLGTNENTNINQRKMKLQQWIYTSDGQTTNVFLYLRKLYLFKWVSIFLLPSLCNVISMSESFLDHCIICESLLQINKS